MKNTCSRKLEKIIIKGDFTAINFFKNRQEVNLKKKAFSYLDTRTEIL